MSDVQNAKESQDTNRSYYDDGYRHLLTLLRASRKFKNSQASASEFLDTCFRYTSIGQYIQKK